MVVVVVVVARAGGVGDLSIYLTLPHIYRECEKKKDKSKSA